MFFVFLSEEALDLEFTEKTLHNLIGLLQPEVIANQILSKFDKNWIEIVRKNWKEENRFMRILFFQEDPMILFERYLATSVQRGDIFSVKTALLFMRDRISDIMATDDGAILDRYLKSHLENVVNIMAECHSEIEFRNFMSCHRCYYYSFSHNNKNC